jgi:hypothetical protein
MINIYYGIIISSKIRPNVTCNVYITITKIKITGMIVISLLVVPGKEEKNG